jgi:hypothetical protein
MNDSLKIQWGNKYINLLEVIIDKEGKVPVFTPNCKFISHDCNHLIHSGAEYFAQKLDLHRIFKL